jgi:geranylgeranyl diphosphate synthase type II
VDDILDEEQTAEQLGKTPGKDKEQGKITFPAVYGIERSREMAVMELRNAHRAVEMFGDRAYWLCQIADLVVNRKA